MALVSWNDKYSVKVREMDTHHQKLLNMINALHDSMKTGKGRESIAPLLQELLLYSKEHFSKEEHYMKLYGYPDFAKQQEQHTLFINKVMDLQQKFNQGNTMISMDILRFLNAWFVDHVCGVDNRYSSFFNEKGLR